MGLETALEVLGREEVSTERKVAQSQANVQSSAEAMPPPIRLRGVKRERSRIPGHD